MSCALCLSVFIICHCSILRSSSLSKLVWHLVGVGVSSEHEGAGSRSSVLVGGGGAGSGVSREVVGGAGSSVLSSSQGTGARVLQASTVIPGLPRSSLGASGVCSTCLCVCVRQWCTASSSVRVFV